MDLRARLDETKRNAEAAVWRLRTAYRVARKTGMTATASPDGARVLLAEIARGRMNSSLIFRYHAANAPHGTALVTPAGAHGAPNERAYSYFELNDTIDRLAAGLAEIGARRGDAVLIALKNRAEFLILQSAIGRLGASAVSVSWRAAPPEIEYIAKNSGARVLFFDASIEGTLRSAIDLVPDIDPSRAYAVGGAVSGFPSFDDLLAATPRTFEDAGADAAVVMYTSGTTGKPKGAVRKFPREALAHVLSFIEQTPMTVGETHLAVCPLYHATAFGFVAITYILGGQVIVMGDFKPEIFLETVERYRVTTTVVVPTMLHRILELGPERIRAYDTSSLKCIFTGGSALTAPLARDVLEVFGDRLYNFYGATETGLVTLAGPDDLRASPGTIGRVVPGQDLRLIDELGREVPDGEVGELFVKSEQLVAGYHADEGATQASMRDGYFSVGDLARRDSRGCYHIEGRKRDMIISGGVNVYPAELEGVIDSHPSVLESAVVGVPDREWGERVRAYVVLRPGEDLSPEALTVFCARRMARNKLPRDVRFMDHLPRNPTGKILKRELREME